MLRVRGGRASWVLRYTGPVGRRREMGLGIAHRGSLAQAGEALTAARDLAHKARELLRQGRDPIDERDRARQAAVAAEASAKTERQREQATLARCARDYHERVIEPSREGRPQSNMAMLAVLDRLGVRDQTTVHGLCRASFSTWANDTGAARPDVIEACLVHGEGNRIRAAYNRAEFAAERRELLAKWAEFLARPATPVLALRKTS